MNIYAAAVILALAVTCAPILGGPQGTDEKFPLSRDPFSPVGFEDRSTKTEEPVDKAPPVPDPEIWPELKLKGIVRFAGRFSAMIDPLGLVQAGEVVEHRSGRHVFTWKIKEITPDAVVSERIGFRPAPNGK